MPEVAAPIAESRLRLPKAPLALLAVMLVVLIFDIQTGALAAAWYAVYGPRHADGRSAAGVYSRLSQNERDYILSRPPQEQAERLMQAAINHDEGALELINQHLESWRGHLANTKTWSDLDLAARYSRDLRVRAAAIGIDLAVFNLKEDEVTANLLYQSAQSHPATRAGNAYTLGMLANRGVEPEKIREWLKSWAHDPDEETRYWAVQGLALVAMDETVSDLIEIFRSDPSMRVRERAGYSLTGSGMLTREQRLSAVPKLVQLADDPALDPTTRSWVYQALRQITNEPLPNRPANWRDWYAAEGTAKLQQIRTSAPWSVPGTR